MSFTHGVLRLRHRTATTARSFLDGSILIRSPLLPTAHEDSDGGVTREFQSERLDQGAAAGLSVTHGRALGENAALAEEFAQLCGGFESTILGQEFFPLQMLGPGNVTAALTLGVLAREFTRAAQGQLADWLVISPDFSVGRVRMLALRRL